MNSMLHMLLKFSGKSLQSELSAFSGRGQPRMNAAEIQNETTQNHS